MGDPPGQCPLFSLKEENCSTCNTASPGCQVLADANARGMRREKEDIERMKRVIYWYSLLFLRTQERGYICLLLYHLVGNVFSTSSLVLMMERVSQGGQWRVLLKRERRYAILLPRGAIKAATREV